MSIGSWVTLPHRRARAEPNRAVLGVWFGLGWRALMTLQTRMHHSSREFLNG